MTPTATVARRHTAPRREGAARPGRRAPAPDLRGSCCGFAAQQDLDDVEFVRTLVNKLAEELCIDGDRVYAMGFSNGGFLSHRLACEASDLVAAIGRPVRGRVFLWLGSPLSEPRRRCRQACGLARSRRAF